MTTGSTPKRVPFPHQHNKWMGFRIELLMIAALVLSSGCKEQKYFQPPPANVNVERAEKRLIAEEADFTGRVVAYETVQIRARVSGELKSMSFRPRDWVKAGSPLFTIEPALYLANVEQAEATLQKAKALASEAQVRLDRMETAFKSRAVREVEVIQQRAMRDSTAADVIAAQVALKKTNIDLSYSRVLTPISGRVSRNYQDLGNLVSATERTLLAEVVRSDKVYVYFNVDERSHLTYIRRHGVQTNNERRVVTARVKLIDETEFVHSGPIDYGSPRIDAKTGTLEIRALLDNPKNLLTPGLFCRVRVPLGPPEQRLLVPIRAIGQDVGGHYLLVVGDDDTVQYRAVELGPQRGRKRVVLKGLQETDWIIVDGLQKARPGSKVVPKGRTQDSAKSSSKTGGR